MPIVRDRLAWSRHFKRQALAFGASIALSAACLAAAPHVGAAARLLPFVMPAFVLYGAYSAFRHREVAIGAGAVWRGRPAIICGILAVILYGYVAYVLLDTIHLESLSR